MIMKNKELIRTVKFTLFSISAGIIQVLLFTLLNELLHVDYWVSYLTSLVASILWNFTINRKITFKSSNNVKLSMLLVFLFYLVFTPVSTVLGNIAEEHGVNEYIVLALTMISNFVLEYIYTRYVVYRNSCDTAVKKDNNECE
ncbi:MAG: GtrA family protein [Clostridia bacterium]|nr:GtrA family protein [Clostridia bacterium]